MTGRCNRLHCLAALAVLAAPPAFGNGGSDTTEPSRFLIVRYDDYAPRDESSTVRAGMELESRLFELFARHEAIIVAGVIPFPTAYGTAAKRIDVATAEHLAWLERPDDPWMVLLKRYVVAGVVEPALHGYSHLNRTPTGFRPGEFGTQSESEQFRLLREARDALTRALDRPVHVFVPPWNGWDARTIRALDRLGFTWCSADPHHGGAPRGAVRVVPQTVSQPADALRLITTVDLPAGSIIVLTTHPADFVGPAGDRYLSDLERLLREAKAHKSWRCVGFGDLPGQAQEDWQRRFELAVRYLRAHALLGDSIGPAIWMKETRTSGAYYPMEWYEGHNGPLWVAVFVTMIVTAAIGALAATLLGRYVLRRRGAWIAATVLAAMGTIVLILGAMQIASDGYAVRGLRWQAIALFVGLTIAGCVRVVVPSRRRPLAGCRPTSTVSAGEGHRTEVVS